MVDPLNSALAADAECRARLERANAALHTRCRARDRAALRVQLAIVALFAAVLAGDHFLGGWLP